MKKTNKIIVVIAMIIAMLGGSFSALCNISKADEYEELLGNDVYAYATNEYEFSASEIISIYSSNSTGHNVKYRYAHDVSKGVLIPVYHDTINDNYGTTLQDGIIDASDASAMISYGAGTVREDEPIAQASGIWENNIVDISNSIAKYYSEQRKTVDPTSIKVVVDVIVPKNEELGISENQYSYSIDTENGYTEEAYQKAKSLRSNFRACEIDDRVQFIKITATTPDGRVFKTVVGTDNNIYLLEPASIEEKKDTFDTTMSYTALDKTTEDDGNTFLAPYTDNDNPKKDSDVTVKIKSTTGDDIVSVVNGETSAELSKEANSLGWYYPNEEDKTVIAKVYQFDTYDNTTYNGKVSETVKLISEDGQEDTQKPSIEWTFRRKTKEETTNNDGSITVVITYNLPVDKDSIPSGWSAIYDQDGETIHKITKTIKKGENYKQDVTVKQFGGDKKVTTTVEKVWAIPQTGEAWIVASVAIIALVVFMFTRRRKIK